MLKERRAFSGFQSGTDFVRLFPRVARRNSAIQNVCGSISDTRRGLARRYNGRFRLVESITRHVRIDPQGLLCRTLDLPGRL